MSVFGKVKDGEAVEPNIRRLENRHRRAVLDVVLTWASIDVSLGYFASSFFDEKFVFGVAEVMGGKPASAKLQEIIQLLKSVEGSVAAKELAKVLRRSKKKLEKYGKCRNHLAHSKCLGFFEDDSETELLVFLKFENVDSEGLAQYKISMPYLEEVLEWGKNFDVWLAARTLEAKHFQSAQNGKGPHG